VLAQVGFGLAAALRFGVEFYRFDLRGAAGPFSTSQWIALLVLGVVAASAVARRWRSKLFRAAHITRGAASSAGELNGRPAT